MSNRLYDDTAFYVRVQKTKIILVVVLGLLAAIKHWFM